MIDHQPQPGDIGLTTITGAVGRAIRVGQWLNRDGFANYEHAFVVLDDETLIEAEPGGAVIRPLTEYQDRHVLYASPELTPEQRDRIVRRARRMVGVPYSFLDYAALAAHRFRLPVPGLRRYVAATGHMICSQLADAAYREAGVILFGDGRWPGYVTPADLYDLLGRGGRQGSAQHLSDQVGPDQDRQ
ncbi:hypothetical protein ACIGXM_11225 [Kitasatospora sp. NPDC052896]|uniref:hypothetical protein n=1 Tax=Kitasatospora sp. NPDC052896 TaxID=3364061 RepID=UPI0037C81B50